MTCSFRPSFSCFGRLLVNSEKKSRKFDAEKSKFGRNLDDFGRKKFQNRPESIGNGFGSGLGVFGGSFRVVSAPRSGCWVHRHAKRRLRSVSGASGRPSQCSQLQGVAAGMLQNRKFSIFPK